jgi:MFS transporter, ACS family, tartrate transporter
MRADDLTIAPGIVEAATIRRLKLRLIPFLLALYVVAFVDRINIGFAALTMNKELAISSQQFGFAAGIFFFGYILFEIPSNLLLHKIGARVWIARILISWGIIAVLTGFVSTAHQLYIARFLLGLAEAGYFPGIVLHLTYWLPQREQAHSIALFMAAIPIASILGSPLSGFILDHVHWWNLSSWRWLLVLEGAPAVVGGVLTYLLLPSRPAEAKFLTHAERNWIERELERDRQKTDDDLSAVEALHNRRVWHLAFIGVTHAVATYSISFWLPQLIKSIVTRQSNTTVGFLLMLPYLVALVAMIIVSRHSDRTLERRYHVAGCAIIAGTALMLLGSAHSIPFSVALLSIAALGTFSLLPVFFSLPGEFLAGFSAASGIALITSIANLGGFAGPYAVGWIRERTGSLYPGLAMVGVSLFLCATLVLLLPKRAHPVMQPSKATTV